MGYRITPIVRLLFPTLLVCCSTIVDAAQDLTIAAASDLQSVFPTVVARFRQETGRTVSVSYGSSGTFFAQIRNGAPFDMFFSADIAYPRQLQGAGLVEPDMLYEYATGKIVLWAPKSSPIDVTRGLRVLLEPGVHHVAIANPAHAPYGRAAVAVLQHEGLYERLREKLVLGENISQTAQFVQSGNAELGILALSLALAPTLKEVGAYYAIPESFYPPIQQAAVVLKSSRHTIVATQFLDFLKRRDIEQLMQAFGFAVPQASARSK